MHYSISGLYPRRDMAMGGYGFSVKLWPRWRELVAHRALTQEMVCTGLDRMGRDWLDACGYDGLFDPDNCGWDADPKAKPGPKAHPMYEPNRDLRVSWGEWGPEHISVPGDACGLDIAEGLHAPRGGRILVPHNVDCWRQVQLLLITFCWFADDLALGWQVKEIEERQAARAAGGGA